MSSFYELKKICDSLKQTRTLYIEYEEYWCILVLILVQYLNKNYEYHKSIFIFWSAFTHAVKSENTFNGWCSQPYFGRSIYYILTAGEYINNSYTDIYWVLDIIIYTLLIFDFDRHVNAYITDFRMVDEYWLCILYIYMLLFIGFPCNIH